ncbi:recombinase family protein [Microbulbifer sp. CAU 1566]|uniref:recombinase family protein n=1 Tax=Microbulbifer sp. CAU 1566 TaxID=2933269 RepID=UPI002002C6CD|nr:recombinase family protein [Microbulbifer sp. CAU 1566]MCK7596902.1 recombinase family protein [Microbulbifer sp. CAU 1566]
MKNFLYARVSSADQTTAAQVEALTTAYPGGDLREEKASATTMDRPVLRSILENLREGDQVTVWKLDRLARNMRDLLKIVEEVRGMGASLEILDQGIDTGTASGMAFLQMLGVFAEFETNLRRERQLAGIAKAKQDPNKYTGRQPLSEHKINAIRSLSAQGVKPSIIAKELGIGVASIYKYRKAG